MKRVLRMMIAMVGLGLLTIIPQSVMAQGNGLLTSAILMQDAAISTPHIQLRFLHPKYETFQDEFFSSEISLNSGSYMLSGSLPVGERGALQISIPYYSINQTSTFTFFGESETMKMDEAGIGNIMVNWVQKLSKSAEGLQSYTSVGVNLPTASEEAFIAALNNYYDIFSMLDESMTLRASYIGVTTGQNISYSFEIGPDFWIPIGDDSDDGELFAHYGFGVTFTPITNLSLRGEWVGLGILSEDDVDFGDRWEHQLAIGARFQAGRFVPGLFWMKNMGDLGDIYESAFGFELGVDL
ncbi:MAG: hypothetical protein IH880_08240 [Candidatus Marinimicrobia bacterium]|nr:hypothetical protein [Candidatus Neomarinimicrobiota bacterium]